MDEENSGCLVIFILLAFVGTCTSISNTKGEIKKIERIVTETKDMQRQQLRITACLAIKCPPDQCEEGSDYTFKCIPSTTTAEAPDTKAEEEKTARQVQALFEKSCSQLGCSIDSCTAGLTGDIRCEVSLIKENNPLE